MITKDDQVKFALLEYRRDAGFRSYVDNVMCRMLEAGKTRPGVSIEEVLSQDVYSGNNTLEHVLLHAFHASTGVTQFERAKTAVFAR
jgi:hypothetical protein